jgi:soluble lytic murein transglycosylase
MFSVQSRQILVGMLLLPVLASAGITPQNRQLYSKAEESVKRRNWSQFDQLRDQLDEYPLALYLDYYRLESQLRKTSGDEAVLFMEASTDTPLQLRFKDKYLRRSGRDRRWEDYLKVATEPPRDITLQCYYYRARVQAGEQEEAWAAARRLWNYGKSRPKACDPLFEGWMKAQQLDDELIWQRMLKAFDARHGGLIGYLSKLGGKEIERWGEVMLTMYRHPASLGQSSLLPADDPRAVDIVAHGLPRLAKVDVAHALRLWKNYESRYPFTEVQRHLVGDGIARYSLLRQEKKHIPWLDDYLQTRGNDELLESRLRWAIRLADWPAMAQLLPALGQERKRANVWRYWQAHILALEGDRAAANAQWQALAQERDYYGFLAAERLGQAYSLNHQPLVLKEPALDIAVQPGVQRASELLYHGKPELAQSEWRYLLQGLEDANKEALSHHASQQGWYRFAIDAANDAGAWDRLELRFPAPYQDVFSRYAQAYRVPDTELLSIARRESAFMPTARSGVGARGLMQLMPRTARSVAKGLGDKSLTRDLYDVEANITLGGAYYRQLLDSYSGNRVLTLAAYNAGPYRVKRWRNQRGKGISVEQWVESIPIKETREYVQGVLAYNVVYNGLRAQDAPLFKELEVQARY